MVYTLPNAQRELWRAELMFTYLLYMNLCMTQLRDVHITMCTQGAEGREGLEKPPRCQLLPSVYIRAEFYLRNMSWNADIEVFPALVVSVRLSSPRLINNTVPAASTQGHVAAVNTTSGAPFYMRQTRCYMTTH